MNDFKSVKSKDQKYVAGTYSRYNFCVNRGSGAECYDIEGKRYIDFSSGIGVNSLGFADADWTKAVKEQAEAAAHISNLFFSVPGTYLAEALCENTGYKKVFLCNSGAEANEGAIKIARKKSFDKYQKQENKRKNIVTLKKSFHGRTVTTLSATGQESLHNFFHPFTEGFVYAEPGDIDDMLAKIDENTCAVMIELIQGEGGVNVLDYSYVKEIENICREKDLTFIVDEIQTGVGRTGKFLCCEHYGITPDIITLAKGLGGGLPIGAVLLNENTCDVLSYGDHGTTFGGNLIACAGACVVVDRITRKGFLDDIKEKAKIFNKIFAEIKEIKSVSGKGLMIGLELHTKKSSEVMKKCVENGLLILTAKEKVRFLPPLTISIAEIEEGLKIFKNVLESN